jgi:hypothetical protein
MMENLKAAKGETKDSGTVHNLLHEYIYKTDPLTTGRNKWNLPC